MIELTVSCKCGREMVPNTLAGRGAFKCPCGCRIKIAEHHDPNRCVGMNDDRSPCRRSATHADPLPLCDEHHASVLASLATNVVENPVYDRVDPEGVLQHRLAYIRLAEAIQSGVGTSEDARYPAGPVVYFIKNGGLIKIGKSESLEERVRHMALSATAILATEPGGIEREHELHARFAEYREHGEWFRPGPKLLAYIASVQRASATQARPGRSRLFQTSTPKKP